MDCPYNVRLCKKCNKLLIVCELNFGKSKKGKYGFKSQCKECDKRYYEEHREEKLEYQKGYYENHKEKIKEHQKEYYEENKEEIKEYKKQYYEENKEDVLKHNKQYREEHKEEIAKQKKQYYEDNKEEILERNKIYYNEHKEEISIINKQYYEENKEYILERNKQYREEHKEEIAEYHKRYHEENPHISFNATSRRRKKEENQGRGITKEQWFEMMCWFDWKCAYSNTPLTKERRTIDHIIPLNNMGINEPWNCVPCFDSYNYQKNTNDMEEWYSQQPYFSEERLQRIYAWCEYAFNKWKLRRKGNKLRRKRI